MMHTSSSTVVKRPRDASCLSVVSFNSTERRAEFFILGYTGYRFITAYNTMLFCSLSRNVETSCHKHFDVVSRHQQTPPLTSSDKCHYFPRSGGTMLITPSRSQRWQHTMKPDIGWESRFLFTPPAFNDPLGGFPSEYCLPVWYEKSYNDGSTQRWKNWWYVYSFWQNVRTWQTDRQTHTDGHRMTAKAALDASIAWQKSSIMLGTCF